MPVVSMSKRMHIVTLIPCNCTVQSLTTLQLSCSHSYIRARVGQWRFNCGPFGSNTLSALMSQRGLFYFRISDKKFVPISQNNGDVEEYGLIPKTTLTKFRTHDALCE